VPSCTTLRRTVYAQTHRNTVSIYIKIINAACLTVSSASVRIIQGYVLYQSKQMILGFYLMTRQAVMGLGFEITLRHTKLGRTSLDEWSARRTDLYLTTQNIRKRKTSMPSAGFESVIPVSERPQTHALDRAATRTALDLCTTVKIYWNVLKIYYVNMAKLIKNDTKEENCALLSK